MLMHAIARMLKPRVSMCSTVDAHGASRQRSTRRPHRRLGPAAARADLGLLLRFERFLYNRAINERGQLLTAARRPIALLGNPDLFDLEHIEHVGNDLDRELHLGPTGGDLV